MIDSFSIILLVLVIVNLGLLLWLFFSVKSSKKDDTIERLDDRMQVMKADLITKQAESLMTLRDSLELANKNIGDRLAEGSSALDRRLSVFAKIENKLGELTLQTANIESIGKNIQSLSELLRPPKSRGAVGEILLENMLEEILPHAQYEIQYKFQDGKRVDAIVKLGEQIIPIDSKFPLDAYKRILSGGDNEDKSRKEFSRALRSHIDDISSRYIKPKENTTEFAVMYIPSEAIYYHLITEEKGSHFEYAKSKQVIPSSPGHFYCFLASVASIYSSVKIAQSSLEKGSKWLLDSVKELNESAMRLEKVNEQMNGSLRRLNISFDKSQGELQKIRGQIERLLEPVTESDEIDDNRE